MVVRQHPPVRGNPKVAVVRTHAGIKEAMREALDGIGGLAAFIRKGEKVFVKPNLTGDRAPSTGAVTHPDVLRALIELIYEINPGKVYLGDSPSWGFDAEKVFEVSGAKKVAEETGCILVNLDKDERVDQTIEGAWRLKKVSVARTVLECDKWVNVPVMKTHMQCIVSLGLKNVKGALPLKAKTKLHELQPRDGYSGLEVGVADLHRLMRPDLTVLDGTIGMEGRGPFDGDPAGLGLMVAGQNQVWVDAVGAEIMGFDPEQIPSLRLCAEVDGIDLHGYEIVGPPIHSVRRSFKPCPTEVYEGKNIRVCAGEVCSGCLATLNTAIHRLMKSQDLVKVSGLALGIGKNPKLPAGAEKRLYVGKCAALGKPAAGARVVSGCPPTGWKIVQGIKDSGR